MIAEVIAVYHGTQDMVQVSAILQENDGSSLHQRVKTASISLLKNNTSILAQSVGIQDFNEEEGAFYVFFIHPPIQQNMYVAWEVELRDGRTARVESAVNNRDTLPYKDVATNPILPRKPVKDHTNTWDAENRSRKPD
jgi:hypothetical protein